MTEHLTQCYELRVTFDNGVITISRYICAVQVKNFTLCASDVERNCVRFKDITGGRELWMSMFHYEMEWKHKRLK